MSLKHILNSSVRFFVFQSKDMATMPELQAGYSTALLIDKLGMNPNLIRIQSCYPYDKFYQQMLPNLNLYPEQCYVFFLENYYHSSSYVLKEFLHMLGKIKNKRVYIHSVKMSEHESKNLMQVAPHVEMIIRTDLEHVIHQELMLNKPVNEIPNLTIRYRGDVINTAHEDVVYDLSDCIFPAYTNGKLLQEKDNVARIASFVDEDNERTDAKLIYRRPRSMQIESLYQQERFKSVMLTTGRGCKYKCSYCFRGVKYSSVRQIPLDVIDADMTYLKSVGIWGIYFYDDCFVTTNKDRLDDVIALMKKHNFMHYIALRYEACTPEILDKLSQVKYYQVQIGLQSITHNSAHKRSFNHDKMVEAVKAFKQTGSAVSLDIILGLPGEGKEEFLKTLDYAISLQPASIVVNTLFLNPGTELSKRFSEFGIRVNTNVGFNVPYIIDSNTFSQQDIHECREHLKKLSDSLKHINFTIR